MMKESPMSDYSHVSRRTAIAGLGAGSLGLLFGSHAAALPPQLNRDTGIVPGGPEMALTAHPLVGRWLSTMGLPSKPNASVAVPSFFGNDGTVMMIFPGTEAARRGLEVKGVALGEWVPVDTRTGHFTAVQVLANLDGAYVGTVTIDGFASIAEDGLSFSVQSNDRLFTVRDTFNAITEHLASSITNPMRGFRMRAGNPGFPDPDVSPVRRDNDPRNPY
jgi:hypothetical protein